VRLLGVTGIQQCMDDHLPVLSGGPRDSPLRHQTLHDIVAWSYALLSPDAQRVFRRLERWPEVMTVTSGSQRPGRTRRSRRA
jgi:predicted ATPase